MKLLPYPKYKPSGIRWLGEVPEHWEVHPLKRRHRVVNGGTPSSSEENYWDGEINWITPEDLGKNDTKCVGRSRRTISLEGLSNCSAQLLPPDSIVISTRAPIGHVTVIAKESCTNQGCRALIPEAAVVCTDYIYYSLCASHRVLQAAGKGTTFLELSAGLLGLHSIPFPPREEQAAIAVFLDRETAKIDTLVAKKRTLIERLKEKRTAFISRTVTRGLPLDAARAAGLDPHATLKPTGIDWLGDVPEHWEVAKLSRVTVSRCDGPFGSGLKSEHYTEGKGIRVVRLQNIRFAEFDDRDIAFIEPEYYRELGDHDVFAGDVLIAGLGDENNPVGRACVAPPALGPAMVKADCFRFRLDRRKVDAAYVALQLSATAYGLAGALASGTTRSRMNLSATATRVVAIPPLIEQISIVSFLSHETAEIDTLIAKLETAIERLHEYRAALITGAVTGKIDVRGTVVREEDAA